MRKLPYWIVEETVASGITLKHVFSDPGTAMKIANLRSSPFSLGWMLGTKSISEPYKVNELPVSDENSLVIRLKE